MSDLIQPERDGIIAPVVLDRPAKLNALTKPRWNVMDDAIGTLSAGGPVRCIVLRGAGDKSFFSRQPTIRPFGVVA
ncbi:MAG TPA: hypothetical protein VFW43_07970 [Polaromonas sp.]|nr:hypothetical protein [Polaromonas sp.]